MRDTLRTRVIEHCTPFRTLYNDIDFKKLAEIKKHLFEKELTNVESTKPKFIQESIAGQ